ncbi:uncharacterized protein TRIADDRAFT_18942 [Trichoplax adhaerens]|uniref:Dynein heavy chain tail domain-containing protein n=1 Tax=Trichoplax adhaerens TaxID=10228 RepID=B3RM49_TRIAD|nr:hypothetical protein TRIADDRAFT_18942 [Trichoplax adhaerens]EDV28901.1 hypothetical protein TRIADDRAFT_18942 [Trichoplax adhaerens]|eukprot:XP_002108103.1 hypothetical protein TRIADDRAFT_18942 [Trichoplax adhaerens]
MDHDERLRWLETRITSSLHARSEDVKNLVSNEENRNVISEFFNKEGKRTMYIYTQTAVLPASLKASFQPPSDLEDKLILIQKCPETGKVSKDNISEEIFYFYLPMLCNEHFNATYGDDKVIDALQKCLSSFQITRGHVDGQIILPLPPIDILADATTYSNRSAAVIHLLESVMIGWIKQIKVALRFEPSHEIMKLSDHNRPGPLAEVEIWTDRYKRLNHIMEQLDQPLASDILNDLENANSTYWHSFLSVRKDILKALAETRSNLVYLNTMVPWFQKLHEAYESDAIASVFPPLIHLLYLVWSNSKYYHGVSQFHRLLSLIANEVVNRAQKLVGKRILEDTEESYLRLKDALRVCARFRGIYLDKKDKADSLNRSKMAALSDTMYQGAGGFAQILLTGGNGVNHTESVALTAELTDKNWSDSPWPARNNSAFVSLNSFMERCNDALELVQTSQHFRCLKSVVDVGGAGGSSLNALVEEIHIKFVVTMKDFLSVVTDVLDIDEGQNFENAFFHFRSVVRDLESRLASILGQTLTVCPTIGAKLRLLEVYEGISCRDNVRASLKSIINDLVQSIMDELLNVRSMFDYYNGNSPSHVNLPPVTGKLLWLYSIRARIQEPMSKMRQVSPDSLEDDFGWQVRHTYSDLINDISRCESEILNKWQKTIQADLRNKLKKHLLIFVTAEDGNGKILQVNLDPGLLLLLREIQYMSAPPLNINLPDNARTLLRSTDVYTIRQIADRLETIASKYNAIMKNMSYFERPLFQEKVDKIHLLLQSGLDNLTWKSVEAPDFIEAMTSLICSDVHRHLSIVQLNSQEINNVIASWSTSQRLDVFSIRSLDHSYSIEEVQLSHSSLREAYEGNVIPSGQRIHTLVKSSFENCQISRASPAWSDYINYLEDLVKRGLKEATMSSLRSMYNQLTAENAVPVLTIRLELIGEEVTFTPPLTKDTSIPSIQEISTSWLDSYLRRASLIKCLKDPDKTNGYRDDIENDLEIIVIVEKIKDTIEERIEEAKKCIAWYNEYSFLWTQDVQQSFQSFLRGKIQSMPESPTVSRPNSRYDKSVTHSATV